MSSSDNKSQKPLKELAKEPENRTRLGDPISLKAETSSRDPKPEEKGAAQEQSGEHKESLAEAAKKNATMLGDPVSLKAESSDTEPTEHDRGAMSEEERRKRGSKL